MTTLQRSGNKTEYNRNRELNTSESSESFGIISLVLSSNSLFLPGISRCRDLFRVYDFVRCSLFCNGIRTHRANPNRGWGMFRKRRDNRPSIISSQFYERKRRGEGRGASHLADCDRSCHLYGETVYSVSGRLKWQAWRDSRRGTNRLDQTTKKKYSRHGAIGSGAVVALLPIIRGLLARGRKRQPLLQTSFSVMYC